MTADVTRRPIRARDTKWAAATARWLARIGLRPNQISVLSAVFGCGAGTAFTLTGLVPSPTARTLCYVLAAAGIQLRLLCNLFDGMVAVEGGFRTKSGAIYNELPDRFSDGFTLVGAGYVLSHLSWLPEVAWLAAILAVITAYVRALGSSAGAQPCFLGPMAKQQRMAVMTAAAVASAVAEQFDVQGHVIAAALIVIVVGCLVTIVRRCRHIIRELETS
ncbi:MAG: CDP-alcohol phosphatidyltransferase family protein [Planctomycetes bacterium]|nr:CDP-alcohol phosphatidyltransferase family protein [Planctomycetota bacterium]